MIKKGFILFAVIFLTGCSTVNHRVNTKYNDYFKEPKKVAVMPLDIKMFRLTAGGMDEYVDEWTQQAKRNAENALADSLAAVPDLSWKYLDETTLTEGQKDFLREQKGLFGAVSYSIVAHTYMGDTAIKSKKENFEYTLGEEISRVMEFAPGDTLLFYSGRNYIWTAGRVMMYLFAATVFGENAMYIVPPGEEWLIMSLVDAKTGDVIWFNSKAMPGDLRDEKTHKGVVKKLMKDFIKAFFPEIRNNE
jgi:hypothetical protein